MKGARKFGVLSLGPLGCLPALRAVNPGANEGGCFEEASGLALAHNNALKSVLAGLQLALQGFNYSNSNLYNWLDDRMKNPSLHGMNLYINIYTPIHIIYSTTCVLTNLIFSIIF